MSEPGNTIETSADGLSKTRRKQASHDLQALGVALVELSEERLKQLEMPERVLDALLAYKVTRSHEGRRRQMQYVGKLMRGVDVELLREAVATDQIGRTRESLALHQAERWRAELLADDEALTRFAAAHARADVQQLRTVIRNARKDAALVPEKRSGRYFRELFQIVKEQSPLGRPEATPAQGHEVAAAWPLGAGAEGAPGANKDKT